MTKLLSEETMYYIKVAATNAQSSGVQDHRVYSTVKIFETPHILTD